MPHHVIPLAWKDINALTRGSDSTVLNRVAELPVISVGSIQAIGFRPVLDLGGYGLGAVL